VSQVGSWNAVGPPGGMSWLISNPRVHGLMLEDMKDIEAPIKDEDATMLEERVNIM